MSLQAQVLTAAIRQIHPGTSEWVARTEADDILDALAAVGWRLTDTAEITDRARARRSDPDTSRMAADSIDDLSERHAGVLFCLYEIGEATDGEIARRYPGLVERFPEVYVPQTEQSLRSRRAELVAAGHVVDTGRRGVSEHGRPCAIWAAADATIGSALG